MQYVCLKCGRFLFGDEGERIRNTCDDCTASGQNEKTDEANDVDDLL